MLVLSRRANETVVFPNLNVTVRILRLKGQAVRLGIDAPPGVAILREELAPQEEAPAPGRSGTHELCNRLNKVGLLLHLSQRQRDAGQEAEAEDNLTRALTALETLDREWVTANLPPPAPTAPPTYRALVVEDDANERELLAGLLSLQGCECATAGDGQEALDYLASHQRPHVVLLDMWMPRRDGCETLRAIRSEPRYEGLRVFAVSGTPPRELGITAGIDAWFPKPLNPRKLLAAIRQAAGVVGN